MEPTTPSPCPYVFGPYPCAKVDGHGGVHLGALDGKWTRPEAEHEEPRVVGSTPKGRTLVAVAEVLEAHEVPGFTSLADVITERLFDEGVIAPPPRLVAVCIRCRVSAPAIDTPWCRQCLEDTLASAIGPTTARDALEALDALAEAREIETRRLLARADELLAHGDRILAATDAVDEAGARLLDAIADEVECAECETTGTNCRAHRVARR